MGPVGIIPFLLLLNRGIPTQQGLKLNDRRSEGRNAVNLNRGIPTQQGLKLGIVNAVFSKVLPQ